MGLKPSPSSRPEKREAHSDGERDASEKAANDIELAKPKQNGTTLGIEKWKISP